MRLFLLISKNMRSDSVSHYYCNYCGGTMNERIGSEGIQCDTCGLIIIDGEEDYLEMEIQVADE